MGYEVYVDHPESATRKAADFSAWSLWAPENAPWTGVSISDMANLLLQVCGSPEGAEPCKVLDQGGRLQASDVRVVYRLASSGTGMPEKVREVFQRAIRDGYPVRVVFSKGFGSIAASAYLAKQSSA